jgi:glutamate synthase (NADPH/NADH) small chain
VVYDRYEQIGGLLQFGIPSFKLDKDVIHRRREVLEGMGVQFRLGVEIGRDLSVQQLLDSHDAVFVGTGAYRYTDGGLDGQDLKGVLPALPFLVQNSRIVGGDDRRAGRLPAGKTPSPCPTSTASAWWCWAAAIPAWTACAARCAWARPRSPAPTAATKPTCPAAREVANAREEGVRFLFNRQPLSIEAGADDEVIGVTVVETRLGEPDANGRQNAVPIEGSESLLEADVVIIAFGFSPSVPAWLAELGVEGQSNGRIVAGGKDRLPFQTAHPRLFAGGDAVRGADLVVTAVAEGRDAAASIVRLLAH